MGWSFLVGTAIVVSLGLAIGILIGAAYLLIERNRARYTLDTYNRPEGVKPLASFVCPECLRRTYAPQHIHGRYCPRCERNFPLFGGSGGPMDNKSKGSE
jgi:hypothetical protein